MRAIDARMTLQCAILFPVETGGVLVRSSQYAQHAYLAQCRELRKPMRRNQKVSLTTSKCCLAHQGITGSELGLSIPDS